MRFLLILSYIFSFLAFICIIAQCIQKEKKFQNRWYCLFVITGIIFALFGVVFSIINILV